MAPQSRIPSQPELSPTYSPTSPSRITAEPIRRNLFSAHLSRRPASQSQSQDSHSSSQPNPRPNSQQSPLPAQHRNISPFASPPRLTPTAEYPPESFNTYDPSQSPNRPLSPRTSATLFPANSIIALDPSTGRPAIPQVPILPPHLTFESDEEDADNDADADAEQQDQELTEGDHHHHHAQYHNTSTHHSPYADTRQTNMHDFHPHSRKAPYSSETHHPSHSATAATSTPTAAESAIITDLMSRYRARQQSHAPVAHPSSPSSQLLMHHHHAAQQRRNKYEPDETDEDEDPESAEERAELMAHLMNKLRRVVESAQRDGWMFGEVDLVGREAAVTGAGGIGGAVNENAGGGLRGAN